MSKTKVIALVVFSVFFIALAGGAIYSKEKAAEQLRQFALKRLKDTLGTDFQTESLQIQFLPATIVMQRVIFPAIPGREDWPRLQVREMTLAFSHWSLLTEVLVIKKVTLKGTRIHLTRTHEGKWIWTASPFPLEGEGPKPTLVRRIHIEDAQFIFQDDLNNSTAAFPDVRTSIRPDLAMRMFEIEFTAREGTWNHPRFRERNLQTSGRLIFHDGNLEIERLELSAGKSVLGLSGNLTMNHSPEPEINLLADLLLGPEHIQKVSWIPENLDGKVHLQTDIRGMYPNLHLNGKGNIQNLHLNQTEFFDGEMVFSFRDNLLKIEKLEGKILGGKLHARAEWILGSNPPEYMAHFQLDEMTMAPLQPWGPDFLELTGRRLSGEVTLDGQGFSADRINAKGQLRIHGRPLGDRTRQGKTSGVQLEGILDHFDQIEATFESHPDQLIIQDARLHSGATSLHLKGSILDRKDLDLEIQVVSTEAPEVLEMIGLKRTARASTKPRFLTLAQSLDFQGILGGTMQSPLIQGELSAQQMILRGHPVGPLTTEIRIDLQGLTFRKALLERPSATYLFAGTLDFHPPQFQVDATVRQGSLKNVIAVFYRHLPMDALLDGDFTIRGRPRAFSVSGDLALSDGVFYGQSFERGQARFEVTPSRISFPGATLRKGQSSLEGEGWISFDGHYSSRFKSHRLYFEDLNYLRASFPFIQAGLELDGVGEGALKSPRFEATTRTADLVIAKIPWGPARMKLTLQSQNLDMGISLEDKTLQMESSMTFHPNLPFQANVRLAHFSLAPLIHRSGLAPLQEVNLITSGKLSISGKALDLESSRIQATLTEIQTHIGNYVIRNDTESILSYDSGLLQIKPLSLRGDETLLSLSGRMHIHKDLDLFINGEADLNIFRLLSQEFSYGGGKAYLVLKITDQWDNPNIQGGITIQDGTLRSETLGQVLTISSMGLFFNRNQIVLENLEGSTSRGHLKAIGKVDLKNLKPVQYALTANLSDIRAMFTDNLSATYSGDLLIQGNTRSQKIRGSFLVKRARYTQRLDLKSWIVHLQESGLLSLKSRSTPYIGDANLELHFYGDKNIWIDNNIAKIPLDIDIFLKGTFDHPLVFGHIEARGGEIYFRHNEFEVKSGSLDFVNPDRIAPMVDLRAQTALRDYQVEMDLAGRLDQGFTLNLTSDPPLSQTDILALLTMGKTAEELEELSGTSGASEATAFTTSLLFNEFVEKQVRQLTGIDRFQIDPYVTSSKAAAGPRLTIQKRLLDDHLSVTYISAVDPAEEQVIKLEYQFSDRVSVIGEQDENGRLGGDFKVRLEFR